MHNIYYVTHNRKVFKLNQPSISMPSIEEHEKTVKELLADIEEKIRLSLVAQRQKIIGFSVSECSANLFAIFLHNNKLITPGFHVNHRLFASERIANESFTSEFENKKEVISILVKIEELRNRLCYGREKEAQEANEAIQILYKLKSLLEKNKENNNVGGEQNA